MPDKLVRLDAIKTEILSCGRCPLALTRNRSLPGQGDPNARIMLVAQAPGTTEDRQGSMFIGPSGRILQELLAAAEIKIDQVFMTNLIKCRLPSNRRPKTVEIQECSYFLHTEIAIIRPEIIVPLGFYATRHIMQTYGIAIPDRRNGFYDLCGTLYLGNAQKIFPLPHPSSLLHNPAGREGMLKKYAGLKVLRSACRWYNCCPIRYFTDQGRLDPRWVNLYCRGDWSACSRYLLEEDGRPHPDNLLPDGQIDPSLE